MNNLSQSDEPENGEIIGAETGALIKFDEISHLLTEELKSSSDEKYKRFVMAALGSIPWMGSFITIMNAVSDLHGESKQEKINELQILWIEEHKEKLKYLSITLHEVVSRINDFGEEVKQRLESPEFLTLVRSVFRSWDQAETDEKKQMLKRLLTNAAASKLCTDDLVRLFIKWIDDYHESHFKVIKEIYQHQDITRAQIWDNIHVERPKDDSAEADLFKYLIRALSTGGVIRQSRERTNDGRFLKKSTHQVSRERSSTLETPFEDSKPYELTELGKQFVHYVLNDVVKRFEVNTENNTN